MLLGGVFEDCENVHFRSLRVHMLRKHSKTITKVSFKKKKKTKKKQKKKTKKKNITITGKGT
jgi:hypothetical protein